jgi:cytochrome b6-f complex iron-sulfur subunit
MARDTEAPAEEVNITRRRLLNFVGWGSFAAFFGGVLLATLRFFFPRVLYEPSEKFIAGKSEDYGIGEVSTRMLKEQRVWMIRNDQGIYALIAVCTHLGCTPIWHADEERIKCPCHGSVFKVDGQNIAGPAPVPLRRAAIELDLAGNIVVDKSLKENQPEKRDKAPFLLALPKKA